MTSRQIIGWCLRGLTLTLALGLLAVLVGAGWVMRYEGIKLLSVQSGSMVPTFAHGDALVIKPINHKSLQPGDIVSYRTSVTGAIISHRIMSFNQATKSFITEGDHNAYPDDPVSSSQIVGQAVAYLPAAGRLFHLIRQPLALIALVYLPATLVIILEALRFKKNSIRPYRLANRNR